MNIDVFIHNAGAYSIPRNTSNSGYDNVFTINFVSPYYIIRELLPQISARGGKVLAVGSIAHRYSEIDKNDVDFRTRLPLMEKEADLVFIFGGTNDYGHGALHIGEVASRDESTFCAQLRLLIEDLIEKYGRERLCFMLPLRRFCEEPLACKGEGRNELGAPLSEYVEKMRLIISEYGIDYIDLYENGIEKPMTNLGDEYTVDGLHPCDKGYVLIADRVCEYIAARAR